MKKSQIAKTISSFFQKHLDRTRPVLLALSGGPDSLALYHAVLAYRKEHLFPLYIAHFDHRWRAESGKEARLLQQYVDKENLPFFLGRAKEEKGEANLEERARRERLFFLMQCAREQRCQAILFAHHADDQAETVLKRLFEGAPLVRWQAMRSVSSFEDTLFWRPLLSIPKRDVLRYVEEGNHKPFFDPTNEDLRFLRARFRQEMIPLLSQAFGKTIAPRMLAIGEEMGELYTFLQEMGEQWYSCRVAGPLGILWDFQGKPLPPPYLFKWLVQRDAHASRALLSQLEQAFFSGKAHRSFTTRQLVCFVDRYRVFFCPNRAVEWKKTEEPFQDPLPSTSWYDLWQKRSWVALPQGNYHLRIGRPQERIGKHATTLGRWWTAHKVPTFLRTRVPVVVERDRIVHEFLTGKERREVEGERKILLRLDCQ